MNVAYVPQGKVIGLSKIARICDMAAKRLQLQERLGADIAEIMREAAGTPDVGVVIAGTHSCMTARGIRSSSARTVTQTFCGKFREDWNLQRLITEGVKWQLAIGNAQLRYRLTAMIDNGLRPNPMK